jgi:protein TonB
MSAHVDILDEREPLSRYFVGSVVLHVGIAGALLAFGALNLASKIPSIGSPNGGGFGNAVAITPTAIPLPAKSGPANPVANPTESQVPAPPSKQALKARAHAQDPDAIPLPSKNALKKAREQAAAELNKWREQQKDAPNQLYHSSGQQLSNPMYNVPGGGGVGVGDNSPFGSQFGWYASALRDKVARNWRTSDINMRTPGVPQVVVTCVIRHDGSVSPDSVKVSQPSGNSALDLSAQRAVLDAAPFGALPPGFPHKEAAVELRFELRR